MKFKREKTFCYKSHKAKTQSCFQYILPHVAIVAKKFAHQLQGSWFIPTA